MDEQNILNKNQIDISKVVGCGYRDFWFFKGRYRVVKGSRASKKSKTMALWLVYHMMKYPKANALVVRKVYRTLKDSCFSELKWAIGRLDAQILWKETQNPLELTYLSTGQKILFRGLDDPVKVASVTVEYGFLCWLWIEEAYEIKSETDFDMLNECIRGSVPDGLFKQVTLTLNPWDEKCWIKKRFFDRKDVEVLAKTTNYLCNEFLDEADKRVFLAMKKNNPKRYRVAGLGEWGVVDGLVFENFEVKAFDIFSLAFRQKHMNTKSVFGLDFGYTNDPSALFCGIFDADTKELFVFDEMYQRALTNPMIYQKIALMGYAKERIFADSAEPKSIDELRVLGLLRIKPAKKGKGSINNGIQMIQGFKIIIHPRCENYLFEIMHYTWQKDRFSNPVNQPNDENNHLMDAMRYACEGLLKRENRMLDFR